MAKRKKSIVKDILNFLEESFEYLPAPFESPYGYLRRVDRIPYKNYYNTVWQMKKRGIVKVESKKGKKFIQLTKKGQLQALLYKSKLPRSGKWDGKWRIVVFDIPESARIQRNLLRRLLRDAEFIKLQNSVFISPYSLNREAIKYLKETKLIDYIRICRVDELDDDKDLRKIFKI